MMTAVKVGFASQDWSMFRAYVGHVVTGTSRAHIGFPTKAGIAAMLPAEAGARSMATDTLLWRCARRPRPAARHWVTDAALMDARESREPGARQRNLRERFDEPHTKSFSR